MSQISGFAERYNTTKEEFSQFIKDTHIQGRVENVLASLQPKEQNLLAKTLGVLPTSLVDCLIFKMKENSLMLGNLKQKISMCLEQVFSCGYSTNYDLELQRFSPGTEDIGFAVSGTRRDDKIPGQLHLQFKNLLFPGAKELRWYLPEDVAQYFYDQDTDHHLENIYWLGDSDHNSGKEGLKAVIIGTSSYSLLNQDFKRYIDSSVENQFCGRDVRRHEDFNKILKGFIKCDLERNVILDYKMDC